MDSALSYIQANVDIAPFVIFGLLLLAGLNVPVSEDLMLLTSALLAAKFPDRLITFYFWVFLGAYFSDLISYWLGRLLGPLLFKIKFFAKALPPDKMTKINSFYEKYGGGVLIAARFVPGIRNPMFLTAGFSKMNFVKFSLWDLLACFLTTVVYFYLYYHYGPTVMEYLAHSKVLVKVIAVVIVGFLLVRYLRNRVKNSA